MTDPLIPEMISVDLLKDGVLWLINTTVFHPRGFALAVDSESGAFSLMGDGTEAWRYSEDTPVIDRGFLAVEAMFKRAAKSDG